MKYKTPRYNTVEIALAFLRSLPDEFEIVEPGMTQVRWPEGLTRDELKYIAARGSWSDCTDALFKLAVIAPVEKKKRKIAIWQWRSGGELRIFDHDINPNGINSEDKNWWIKKGEGEVSE